MCLLLTAAWLTCLPTRLQMLRKHQTRTSRRLAPLDVPLAHLFCNRLLIDQPALPLQSIVVLLVVFTQFFEGDEIFFEGNEKFFEGELRRHPGAASMPDH